MRHTLAHPIAAFRADWADLPSVWRVATVTAMLLSAPLGLVCGLAVTVLTIALWP